MGCRRVNQGIAMNNRAFSLLELASKLYTKAKKKRRTIYLIASFSIAVFLAPWTEHRYDIYVFRLWPALITEYNLFPLGSHLYSPTSEPHIEFPPILGYAYPPVWLYVSIPLFRLWQSIVSYQLPSNPSNLWIYGIYVNNIAESYRSFVPSTLPHLDLLLKLPSILSFCGVSYLLMKLAERENQERQVLLLWMLNPYVIQIVAVWGSFDALAAFFAFASLYLLHRERWSASAILLALGFGSKLFPAFFLIPNLIFAFRVKGSKGSLKYLSVFVLMSGIIFGSFAILFPRGLEFLISLFIGRASPDMYGATFISGMTWLGVLNLIQWTGSVPIFPLIFVPIYFLLICLFWSKASDRSYSYVIYASILLLFYISYTVINPQYFLWILPFLLFLVTRQEFPRKSYLVISMIPFVWTYVHYSALYFISPIAVWNEVDYPPWSYVTNALRAEPFVMWTEAFLIAFISLYVGSILLSMLRKQWKDARQKPQNP